MRPDPRGPAGQVEAAASDIFRNVQRRQCDRLCCVHKGTKGVVNSALGLHHPSRRPLPRCVIFSIGALLPSPGGVRERTQ